MVPQILSCAFEGKSDTFFQSSGTIPHCHKLSKKTRGDLATTRASFLSSCGSVPLDHCPYPICLNVSWPDHPPTRVSLPCFGFSGFLRAPGCLKADLSSTDWGEKGIQCLSLSAPPAFSSAPLQQPSSFVLGTTLRHNSYGVTDQGKIKVSHFL